eukprot:6313170-Prymnesium_polylepis.1
MAVRVVSEVSRGVTARDEYEKELRRLRFESYEQAMALSGGRAVFFGHHIGDLQARPWPAAVCGAAVCGAA